MTASQFAKNTTVSPERSKAEIERLLQRFGATKFVAGWDGPAASLLFEKEGRRIRFRIAMPDLEEFRHAPQRKTKWGSARSKERTDRQAELVRDQEVRRRWRALALVIKAKIESVQTGVCTFEEEFLSHIVIPGMNRTVAERVLPELESAYAEKSLPPLLPPRR